MNKKIIVYLLGWIMNMEAIFMLLPCAVAVIYRESSGIWFLAVMAVCGTTGLLLITWYSSPKRVLSLSR